MILFILLVSFLSCLAFMPAIIRISHSKNILDHPGPRKMHGKPVPLLGGAGVFAATILSLLFFGARSIETENVFVLTGLLLMFFMGLRDDVQPMGPLTKLIGQLTAASIAVFLGGIRLYDFHGLFGIYVLPYAVSALLSVTLIVFMVNAINFIDGIDGLAGSLIVLVSLIAGIIFSQSGDYFFAGCTWSLAGAMLGFLYFNLPPARVYLGDTGSTTAGFLCAVFAIRLGTGFTLTSELISPHSGLIISTALLLVPVVDALRMIFQRLLEGRSPFRPDNEHIHHLLLRSGWSHRRILLTLTILQISCILAGWIARNSNPTLAISGLLFGTLFLLLILKAVARKTAVVAGK